MKSFPDLTIDELQPQHLLAVMALESAAHSHPWSEKTMSSSIVRHRCWGLFKKDQLLGFAVFSVVLDEAELLDCVIDPSCQGQGLGGFFLAQLLERIEVLAQRVYLEVRQSNAAAIAMYQTAGFVEIGVRQGYYPAAGGREDAVLMACEYGFSFME